MEKQPKKAKSAVVSFRTTKEVRERIDRERKRRKQTRSDFVEAMFMTAFDLAAPAEAK